MSLYPTPTRLALLQDIAVRDVIEGINGEDGIFVLNSLDEPRRVTAQIEQMARAGWVELDDAHLYWQLTAEGRRVLGGAP